MDNGGDCMRRFYLVLMLVIVITLSACSNDQSNKVVLREGRQVAETTDEYFKMVLYSENDVYEKTEEVDIWGTIEYIGEEDSIDIHSGSPYYGFTVESEGVRFITNNVLTLLQTTTLDKGVIYEFPLLKFGGYSEDDENADFWRNFYSEEKMLFPIGVYNLVFSTEFYIETGKEYELSIQYNFEVK